MSVKTFIEGQLLQIQQDGRAVLSRKMNRALQILFKLPLYISFVSVVVMICLVQPWLLVRLGGLITVRIGHFAANTELYLCEQDAGINAPKQRHVDLFYMAYRRICNQQLTTMWKRILHVWPSWILAPMNLVNHMIPGGVVHEIGNNTQHDRDVHNLLDRFPPHLEFTPEEKARGAADLNAMGIPLNTPFVCLIVRNSAYLEGHMRGGEWSYHNYRDSGIQNYILAAEALANRGYFVIGMGAKVREAMKTAHPRIIDYATNGMRSDFMDIYLGAKCESYVTTSTGWMLFLISFIEHMVITNDVPLGYAASFNHNNFLTTRVHRLASERRSLTVSEISKCSIGFSDHTSDYASKGNELIENTPEEIRDVVIEMAERLNGTWQPREDDEVLKQRFWEIFPTDGVDVYQGRPLHGEIPARFGAHFLRQNKELLD